MNINQKTVVGNNNITINNGIVPRALTQEGQARILTQLKAYNATSVAIHFESSGETKQYVQQIEQFLKAEGFEATCFPHAMSEYPLGIFSIEPPKEPSNWVYIRVGSLN